MNIKPYLTTILFFAAIFVFCFSSNAQNSADTISIVKKGVYYQNEKQLNFKQLMHVSKENEEAYNYMIKAQNMNATAYIFGLAAGGCIGGALGYALGSFINGNRINAKIFFPFLGAGICFTAIGITFDVSANDYIRKGINVYNNSIKQKHSRNLDLGFYTNGVLLRLNF